jgi:hypothetical protein
MVDVADGAHVDVRFRSLKLLLCHFFVMAPFTILLAIR